jgi:lysophospholipase L1-like esterase
VRAGFNGVQRVAGRWVPVRTNSLGMRGREPARRTLQDRRILFLGDSMPFGHGVEAGEAFPELTARLLQAQHKRPVVAGNAGVPRNAHRDQVRDLRRHLAPFDADVVVSCVYAGNDFHDDFAGPMAAVGGYLFDTAGARLARASLRARLSMRSRLLWKVEQLLQRSLPALAYDRSPLQPTAAEAARFDGFPARRYEEFENWQDLFMDAVEPLPVVATVLDRMTATLTTLREEARGARLVVVVIPTWVQAHQGVYEEYLRRNLGQDPARYRRGLGAQRLAERCAALGLPMLDLTAAIAAHPAPARLFLQGDGHLSAEGHRAAAEALAKFLAPFVQR